MLSLPTVYREIASCFQQWAIKGVFFSSRFIPAQRVDRRGRNKERDSERRKKEIGGAAFAHF